MNEPIDWDALVAAAEDVRSRSHSPYSRFPVGAAVLMEDGEIYRGCNVENRSYGLTICAERVAVATAVADGRKRVRAVAVVADTDPPSAPCGMCRETLVEFADPDLPILLVNPAGDRARYRLAELHAHPFVMPESLSGGSSGRPD